jgi:iron complex transport system substrate-binding protein
MNKGYRLSLILSLSLILWLEGASGSEAQGGGRTGGTNRNGSAAAPVISGFVVDDLGDTLRVSVPPQRIVSLAPSNTELLFAMGLGHRLVGVTDVCNYPAAADSIDKVAGYSSLNAERIVAVAPDLVLAARGNDLEGLQTLRELDIPVFALAISSVEELFGAIERLGRLCGSVPEAAALETRFRRRVEAVNARAVAASGRPGVIWCYWGDPVYTAGRGTMIDHLIQRAGGRNVARAAPGSWPQVSVESVLSWSPEVIITSYLPDGPESLADELARLRTMAGWKSLPAVISERVYYLDADIMSRPGPRSIDALEMLVSLLHPNQEELGQEEADQEEVKQK